MGGPVMWLVLPFNPTSCNSLKNIYVYVCVCTYFLVYEHTKSPGISKITFCTFACNTYRTFLDWHNTNCAKILFIMYFLHWYVTCCRFISNFLVSTLVSKLSAHEIWGFQFCIDGYCSLPYCNTVQYSVRTLNCINPYPANMVGS